VGEITFELTWGSWPRGGAQAVSVRIPSSPAIILGPGGHASYKHRGIRSSGRDCQGAVLADAQLIGDAAFDIMQVVCRCLCPTYRPQMSRGS